MQLFILSWHVTCQSSKPRAAFVIRLFLIRGQEIKRWILPWSGKRRLKWNYRWVLETWFSAAHGCGFSITGHFQHTLTKNPVSKRGRLDGWKYKGAMFSPGLRSTVGHHSDKLWKDLEDACDSAEFIHLSSSAKMVFCLWLTCHWHLFYCATEGAKSPYTELKKTQQYNAQPLKEVKRSLRWTVPGENEELFKDRRGE